MLAGSKVVAFLATSDAARAKAFYGEVLGLHLLSEDGFAVVFDSQGTVLRVTIVQEVVPAPYTVLGWDVPDITAIVRGLAAAGSQARAPVHSGQAGRSLRSSGR